jgi:hypothetical protein
VPGQPVGQGGEHRAAEQPRQVADREGEGRQQRGRRPLVDEDGESDPRQLVTGRRQQEGAEQRPELADGEDLSERRRAFRCRGGQRPVPIANTLRGLVITLDPSR